MHASRHRGSPGNGYRPNSAGMGLPTSQISPENSVRGRGGFYNSSENRNLNRNFGRGQSKFHQPLQPSRRGDVFMEAGRLAAEYLVSQGLLPASALSFPSKRHVGDFQEFKPKEGGGFHLAQEGGRTSALARLGSIVPDAVSGRRRFPDEYSQTGSRSHVKGRRKLGSRSQGSSWSRENGRSGSWSEKARPSLDLEVDFDNASGYDEEQRVGKDDGDGGKSFTIPTESAPKSENAGGLKSEIYQLPDITESKISGAGKDLPLGTDADVSKRADVSVTTITGIEKVKDGTGDDVEKKIPPEDPTLQPCALQSDQEAESNADLQKLCRFVDMPKRTRSSLMHKGSKSDSLLIPEAGSIPDANASKGSGVSTIVDSVGGSSGDTSSNPTRSPKCPDSEVYKTQRVQSVEDIRELNPTYSTEKNKCNRSHSFPDGAFLYKQEQGPPGFGGSTPMAKERGEKRAASHNDAMGEAKKPREWISSVVTLDNDYINLLSSREKEPISPKERTLLGEEVVEVAKHETLVSIAPFSIGSDQTCIEYAEEKLPFSSSAKTCDLNLMEALDTNKNHDSGHISMYPSTSETKKECASVIDLSMSNDCGMSDEHVRHAADGKEIEVIDLEIDSVQEDKSFSNSEKKEETVFTTLEGFPSNMQSSDDINDVQDNYGLISELLGADISACSSVPADINSLQNEMNLHNGEAILGDDDPIYMSLGEIPIGFPQAWEQPTQDYEKPF